MPQNSSLEQAKHVLDGVEPHAAAPHRPAIAESAFSRTPPRGDDDVTREVVQGRGKGVEIINERPVRTDVNRIAVTPGCPGNAPGRQRAFDTAHELHEGCLALAEHDRVYRGMVRQQFHRESRGVRPSDDDEGVGVGISYQPGQCADAPPIGGQARDAKQRGLQLADE